MLQCLHILYLLLSLVVCFLVSLIDASPSSLPSGSLEVAPPFRIDLYSPTNTGDLVILTPHLTTTPPTSTSPLISTADSLPAFKALPEVIFALPATFGPAFAYESHRYILALPHKEDEYGCQPPPKESSLLSKAAETTLPSLLVTRRGVCTFMEKALHAQARKFDGVIIINDADETFILAANTTQQETKVSIPVIGVSQSHGHVLWKALEQLSHLPGTFMITSHNVHNDKMPFSLVIDIKSYKRPFFDWSFIVMYLLAIFSLIMASFYSSTQERRKYHKLITRHLLPIDGRSNRSSEMDDDEDDEDSHSDTLPPPEYLDTTAASLFVVFASISLFILFFFLKYLIYMILIFFCIGAAQGMTVIFISIFRKCCVSPLSLTARVRRQDASHVDIPLVGRVTTLELTSFALAVLISLVWFLYRKTNSAWMLQDFMSVCLLLVIQCQLRLPNIKVSSILLSMAFIYDIFWVFISPYFFSKSVMVVVASGGDTGEAMPMLFRVPRFNDVLGGYSMLGLGDIALPGLFVAYLLRFDFIQAIKRETHGNSQGHPLSFQSSYFLLSCIGYAVGLILTYLALFVSSQGQPALLYLVPCCLGPVLLVAWKRNELTEMWNGLTIQQQEEFRRQSNRNNQQTTSSAAESLHHHHDQAEDESAFVDGDVRDVHMSSNIRSDGYQRIEQ